MTDRHPMKTALKKAQMSAFIWPRSQNTSESRYELINTKPGTSQLQNGAGPAIFLATRAAATEFACRSGCQRWRRKRRGKRHSRIKDVAAHQLAEISGVGSVVCEKGGGLKIHKKCNIVRTHQPCGDVSDDLVNHLKER